MDHDQAELNDAGEHKHVYASLTPDAILLALESAGWLPEAALHTLNSFENRVYSFRDESEPDSSAQKFVVKFYRPGRWSVAQIQEEHDFLFELADTDIPVIAPVTRDGRSVFEAGGFAFAVFPQRGGRPVEAGNDAQLEVMGRTVGRLHAVAQQRAFTQRERLDAEHFARPALQATLASPLLPPHLASRYRDAAERLLDACNEQLQRLHDVNWQRCHGDLHPGNILWTGDGVLLIDFDDCRTAPAVQDLWMLANSNAERALLVSEYEGFCDFDWREWQLAEVFRAMRLVQYGGWLAQRWDDPTFPRHFPWFGGDSYFAGQINLLTEQLSAVTDGANSD